MKYSWFEFRENILGPLTSILQIQFMFLFWIKPTVEKYPILWIFAIWPALAFIIQDFLYQVVIATLIFWELPRDWLFTGRISRLSQAGDWRAERFKQVLNENDPGHVKDK